MVRTWVVERHKIRLPPATSPDIGRYLFISTWRVSERSTLTPRSISCSSDVRSLRLRHDIVMAGVTSTFRMHAAIAAVTHATTGGIIAFTATGILYEVLLSSRVPSSSGVVKSRSHTGTMRTRVRTLKNV